MFNFLRLFFLVLLLGAGQVWAEEEGDDDGETEEGEAAPAPAIYIPLKPQFVVNYGGAGKLRFLKAGVTLRLANSGSGKFGPPPYAVYSK